MNPFWTQIIIQTTLKNRSRKPNDKIQPSGYKFAKVYREFVINLKRLAKDAILFPFVILGYKIMGRQFAIKSALAITGLSICLATVTFLDVTKDNLLVAVFGGFFLGTGIGLAIRGGAVIDGTEVLAIFLSRKTTS